MMLYMEDSSSLQTHSCQTLLSEIIAALDTLPSKQPKVRTLYVAESGAPISTHHVNVHAQQFILLAPLRLRQKQRGRARSEEGN